jgi:hypothetical protein
MRFEISAMAFMSFRAEGQSSVYAFGWCSTPIRTQTLIGMLFRKIILFYCIGLSTSVLANNIAVSNVSLTGQNTAAGTNNAANFTLIQFDLSWNNSWSVLKKVTALGFHSSEYTYPEVLDASQYDGVRYYRLRQVDFDGKQEYFQPVAADCPNSGTAVSIYPNPASEQLRIQGAEPGTDWEIFDVSARSLLRGNIQEEGTELISVLSLPAGLYHMHLQNRVFPFLVLE